MPIEEKEAIAMRKPMRNDQRKRRAANMWEKMTEKLKTGLKLLAFAALPVLFAGSALALSGADYRKMLKVPVFADADAWLNKAWKELSAAAPKAGMEAYRKAQDAWVAKERDALAKRMPQNDESERTLAYARVTEDRARLIEEWIKQEKDAKYVPSFTGQLIWTSEGTSGGYYDFIPDEWHTPLRFYNLYDDVDAAPIYADLSEIIEATEENDGKGVWVKVTGRLDPLADFDNPKTYATLSVDLAEKSGPAEAAEEILERFLWPKGIPDGTAIMFSHETDEDGAPSFVFAVGKSNAEKFTAERYYRVTKDGKVQECGF
jgi:hypothetical protein